MQLKDDSDILELLYPNLFCVLSSTFELELPTSLLAKNGSPAIVEEEADSDDVHRMSPAKAEGYLGIHFPGRTANILTAISVTVKSHAIFALLERYLVGVIMARLQSRFQFSFLTGAASHFQVRLTAR